MEHKDNVKTFILKEPFPSIKKYDDVMRSSVSMYKKKAINKNIIDYISSQIRYHEIQKFKSTNLYGLCITWIKRQKRSKITDFSYLPELIIKSMTKEKIHCTKEKNEVDFIDQRIADKNDTQKTEISAIVSILSDTVYKEHAFLLHDEILSGELEL